MVEGGSQKPSLKIKEYMDLAYMLLYITKHQTYIKMEVKCKMRTSGKNLEKKNLQQHRRKDQGLQNISVIIVITILMIEAMY